MRCLAALLATALGLWASTAEARIILNRNDLAFANAVSIQLPPDGMPTNATTFSFASNGLEIGLTSLSGHPLAVPPPYAPGLNVWTHSPGQGVTVSLSPQVVGIGFVVSAIDGCVGATFVGSTATDTRELPFGGCTNVFLGSVDIGSIGAVNLQGSFGIYRVTEILVLTGGPPPPGNANLSLTKSAATTPRALPSSPIRYGLTLRNASVSGTVAAQDVSVVDFLPDATYSSSTPAGEFDDASSTLRFRAASLAVGGVLSRQVDMTTAAVGEFTCESALTNIAVATSAVFDPLLANNVATSTIYFDRAAVAGSTEICGNLLDDDCNGLPDCSDPACDCRPVLPEVPESPSSCSSPFAGPHIIQGLPGQPPLVVTGGCDAEQVPAERHECRVPRGPCGGVTVPAYCCDPATWSNPSFNGSDALAQCDLGVPGCVPVDPNFKESDPTVNIAGYGQTDAGRLMTYIVHYENIGTADALNVKVIDVLEPDLDVNTLTIDDGGRWEPSTRTIVWTDPVVPPHTPRAVTFRVRVRSDALPGTRVRNTATIVFPNAVPPSRVDTEFIEHVIVDPASRPAPALRVKGCMQTTPGHYAVELVNDGAGFAYNARASIVSTPDGVVVSDADASFAHPDDTNPSQFSTVIPIATTTSHDGVAFGKIQSGDPCPTFTWRVRWENLQGEETAQESQPAEDFDADGVPDEADNCLYLSNSLQLDFDRDGIGNECDISAPCDVDGDQDVDKSDTAQITAARNQSAYGPEDPRDRDGDGRITVLDARQCVLECTRARCATQ